MSTRNLFRLRWRQALNLGNVRVRPSPLPSPAAELPLERIAGVTRSLSVMLAAGLSPLGAWKQVAFSYADYEQQFTAAISAALEGRDLAEALNRSDFSHLGSGEKPAWQALAAAWWVGTRTGANLARSLRSLAQSLAEIASCQRQTLSALAGPRATAKFIGYLPVFSLLLGWLLGFNPLGVLLFTPPGWFCAVGGLTLTLIGRRWSRRLLKAALPRDLTPGLDCELSMIALQGGGALASARQTVEQALEKFQLRSPGQERIEQVYRLSHRSGAPAGLLLQAEAELARTRAVAFSQQQVGRLSVRLLMPLGLCVLPAFILWGIVPLVMSVFSSSLGGNP